MLDGPLEVPAGLAQEGLDARAREILGGDPEASGRLFELLDLLCSQGDGEGRHDRSIIACSPRLRAARKPAVLLAVLGDHEVWRPVDVPARLAHDGLGCQDVRDPRGDPSSRKRANCLASTADGHKGAPKNELDKRVKLG